MEIIDGIVWMWISLVGINVFQKVYTYALVNLYAYKGDKPARDASRLKKIFASLTYFNPEYRYHYHSLKAQWRLIRRYINYLTSR